MNVWMLPEVTAMRDHGYELQAPQFNGEILTAMVLPAFAEPTFVGEIVLVGTGVILVSAFAYNWVTYYNATKDRDNNLQHCLNLYESCTTNKPYLACGTCLSFCEVQGYWDFSNCPNVSAP